MVSKVIMIVMLWIVGCYPVWAEEVSRDLSDLRSQARDEQRKEEEIQMMRLELEKLKIELETRQTMASIGGEGMKSSSSALTSGSDLYVESIVVMPSDVKAVIRIAGERRLVKENDAVGTYLVKKINSSDVVFMDNKGLETSVRIRK